MKKLSILLTVILVACSQGLIEEPGSITAYFCYDSSCEDIFLTVINDSQELHCAFYDLQLQSFRELLEEKSANVLVYEEPIKPFTKITSRGLMHHKFCVIDTNRVITGSMNPTTRGVDHNDNVIFIIDSNTIANNFLEEFNNLQTRNKQTTKNQEINLTRNTSIIVQNFFCPQDDCETKILEVLGQAKHSIHFLTFTFTSDNIGDLLVKQHEQGVLVAGVFERRTRSEYWQYDKLFDAGAHVVLDNNPYTMHHKTFIIDERIVVTGTYNPTRAANERNDEVVFVIYDYEIAQEFMDEFERIWQEAHKEN